MQLASQGLRFATNLTRKAPNVANRHNVIQPSRGVHIPSSGRIPPHIRLPNPGTAQKLFSHSRNLVSRFVTHLTAPGLATPLPPSVSRHAAHPRGIDAFRQGLSFPVRTALSRPLHQPFLPRPPTVPRHIAEVGLGTARRFSTGRPIFQHLVDNVPVVGRAFYELDWDTKMEKERELMRLQRRANKVKKTLKGKELAKPKQQVILEEMPVNVDTKEFDHYFSKEDIPEVTTYLLVPLAPTPTGRAPLPSNTVDRDSLLPLPTLARMHADHQRHSTRVAALFSRLDAANVWEDGVQCHPHSHLAPDAEGNRVCSAMKLVFVGWTKAQVRGVIGESGTGWCALDEVRTNRNQVEEQEDFDDSLSDVSNPSSFASGEWASGYSSPVPQNRPGPSFSSKMETDAARTGIQIDPSQSFVLPTLDFSAALSDPRAPPPASASIHFGEPEEVPVEVPPQPFSPRSETDFDPWSEVDSDAAASEDDEVMSVSSEFSSSFSDISSLSSPTSSSRSHTGRGHDQPMFVDPPSLNGWFGFNSRYERGLPGDEPRAELFM